MKHANFAHTHVYRESNIFLFSYARMKTTLLRSFLIVSLISVATSIAAKPPTLKQLFMSMPGSVLALDSARRSDLMAYYFDKKVDSVSNGMNGYIHIRLWDENTHHLILQTSRRGTLELQVFDKENPEFIAISKTVCAPACLSRLSFYTLNWDQLSIPSPDIHASDFLKTTLSAYDSTQAMVWMTPMFVRYSFDESRASIIATCDQKDFLGKSGWKGLQPDMKTSELRFVFHQGEWKPASK